VSTEPAAPARFRWFSMRGEFAFLSIGGSACGVIAIGGMAHGVIAFGGIISIGVISVGMNAIGSVAALGLNAVAPIGISLINGAGFMSVAAVNSCGTWSAGGVNSTGMESDGGVNSGTSVLPTVVLFVIGLVAALVARGRREPRTQPTCVALGELTSGRLPEGLVQGRLRATEGGVAISTGGVDQPIEISGAASGPVERLLGRRGRSGRLYIRLAVDEEQRRGEPGPTYRIAPDVEIVRTLRCLSAETPDPPWWLPVSRDEVQWWIARTLIASLLAVGVLLARGPWL